MVFSSDPKARVQRKAEAKAVKTKARLEAKLEAKNRRKSEKARRRADRKFRAKEQKDQRKTAKVHAKAAAEEAKAQAKAAEAEAKAQEAKVKADADGRPLSPNSVKRYLTVAKLVSPVVMPVAYRGAVAARGQITNLQASRAGVSPDVLRQYSGHGATLSARISTSRAGLQRLSGKDAAPDSAQFVSAMSNRLDNLAVAVQAAESMPPRQRRNAHRSIESELSAIHADILARLGVKAG